MRLHIHTIYDNFYLVITKNIKTLITKCEIFNVFSNL